MMSQPLFILNVQTDPGQDPEANLAQVEATIQDVKGNYSRFDLICLPEHFSLGLRKRLSQKTARWVTRRSLDSLERWARDCNSYLVGGTIPEVHGDRLYDTAFLLDRQGQVIGQYRKIHLYADWGETAIFTPGDEAEVVDLEFTKLGLAICRDLRFPDLFRELRAQGAEIFCVPSMWNYPYEGDWEILGRCRALENQAYCMLTNITGIHISEKFFGRSMVVDFRGNVISMMDDQPGYQVAQIDLAALRKWRKTFRIFE
ncbi:MAG: nitrilase-related carbon-nitrogen hydrolase [Candidatus Bipolaricaulia bacterium]